MNPPPLQQINIIGCGRLGRGLAKLWSDSRTTIIGGICNRTLASGQDAHNFIQAGTAVDRIEQLPEAHFWLIATADGDISPIAKTLASHSRLAPGNIVFHCSGSLSAKILEPLSEQGLHTASVHPIHSFADPLHSQQSFSGSYCAMEGHPNALADLEWLFAGIGGNTFRLDNSRNSTDQKALYHAATAMASNHLVTLLNSALDMLQHAGIERSKARELLAPIVAQTADNVHRHDCVTALTGPVARGDKDTIERHLAAIQQHTPELLPLYKMLAQQTLPLAEQQATATLQQLNGIADILKH